MDLLMNLSFIVFYLTIVVKINSSQSDLLKIDPLSINVDPVLHQLCWNSVGDFEEKQIFGTNDKDQEMIFDVFPNLQLSNRTYCIQTKDLNTKMVIRLPFNRYNLKDVFSLSIMFSIPLGPKLDVIRSKAVRNGIHFQISTEYGAISTSEIVKCNVTMISKNIEMESVRQFSISSGKIDKMYLNVNDKSSITAYSTCLVPGIIDYSTKFIKYDGYTLFSEYTTDLKPFIPLPLKRFLMVTWKHPENIPNIYNIAIYEKLQSGKEICMRIFRMKNELIRKSKWKTIVKQCDNKIATDDLGYYNGRNEHIFAILDLISPLNIYSNYKLSIFWENSQAEIAENFLYFTPIPNDNNARINSMFLNFMKFSYDEIRNNISSFNQNFIPSNDKCPVMDNKIDVSGYKYFTILPSISDKDQLNYNEIKYSEKAKYIQECLNLKSCSNEFYPFFYLLLFTDVKAEQIYVEIVQIPFQPDDNLQIFGASLSANNDDLTFNVSWKVTKNIINPGIYGIQITDTQSLSCEVYYIVACNTCNEKYSEISKTSLPILKNCKSTITIKENQLTAASKHLSFNTNKMPESIIFQARVFAAAFSKLYQSDLSNSAFIKDNSGKKNLILSITFIFIIFVIILIITGFVCRYRKAKAMKEIRAKVDHSNDSLYDEDVEEPHCDYKTPYNKDENAYELS